MSERKEDPKLIALRESGAKTYSISKLNTMDQCPYQAYLNYVLHTKQKNESIYGRLGTKVHDTVEAYVHGDAKNEDIKAAIQNELADLEMFGIDFPTSKDGSSSIRDNWVANMNRFAEEFSFDTSQKTITEKLLLYKIDNDHFMMGYVDAFILNNDGTVSVIDWKTSSNFDKAHLLSAGRQLIVYKLALEQSGYTVKDCKWCMLKYCETTWIQKNGKPKSKVSEWRNLIKDMQSTIEKALADLGYDETDIECYITSGLQENSWSVFPKEIQEKFDTHVYFRDYDITPELIDECKAYIEENMSKFESFGEDEINYTPCDVAINSYFCTTLCGYGGKSGQCKFYVDYCEKFEDKKDEFDDLF